MTNQHLTRGMVLIMSALVVVAMVGPALAAAPSTDTETTDTAETSDIVSGTTISAFDANASNTSVVRMVADTNNTKIEIRRNDTGQMVYSNSSMYEAFHNSTSGDYFMEANLSHDELKELERDANENVTMELRMYNDTEATSPDTANVTFYIENDGSETVVHVADNEVGENSSDVVEIKQKGRDLLVFDTREDYSVANTLANVESPKNTTVTYVFGNGSTASTYTAAEDNMKSLESGDVFWLATSEVEDKWVRTYYESANTSDETHAVFHSSYEGNPAVSFHYDTADERFEDLSGRTQVENTAYGNNKPSPSAVFNAFGIGAVWDSVSADGLVG